MRLEGKIVQLIAIITIAAILWIAGPWVVDTLGGIFKILGGRDLNIEQL